MGEGFKLLVCVLIVMAAIAESASISPPLQDNFLPPWMYAVISFYGVWLVIDMRIVPLFREFYDLVKKMKDS